MSSVSRDDALALLDYDPATGVFLWKTRHEATKYDKGWNKRFAGTKAGTIGKNGYVKIIVRSHPIYAHRLAFLLMTGSLPDIQVDHIDGDRTNNRWENLRGASEMENSQNRVAILAASGCLGVSWHGQRMKWAAEIVHQGKKIFLGLYETREEASIAYRAARLVRNAFHRNAA